MKFMKRWFCIAALLLTACDEDVGSGSVTGWLKLPSCEDNKAKNYTCDDEPSENCEAFDLEVDFFAFEVLDTLGVLRMQHGGQVFSFGNGLLLNILDVTQVSTGSSQAVGLDENIRGNLGLFELCSDSQQNLSLRGEVMFERFGTDEGDRIKGSFSKLEVIDGRDTEIVLGELHGEFSFKVRKNAPSQKFPHSPEGWYW